MIAGEQEVYTAEERFRGYVRALEQAGIAASESLVVRGTIPSGAEAGESRSLPGKIPT